ncbi:hypothetical protein [New Jersey aster yellows phytoplasma]
MKEYNPQTGFSLKDEIYYI